MEQILSWETNRSSAGLEIPSFLEHESTLPYAQASAICP